MKMRCVPLWRRAESNLRSGPKRCRWKKPPLCSARGATAVHSFLGLYFLLADFLRTRGPASHELLMTPAVRAPAVAGRFYPGRAEGLLREVREFTPPSAR